MSRAPQKVPRLRGSHSPAGTFSAMDVKARKRLDALVTNYLLQGMPEGEAIYQAVKDVLRRAAFVRKRPIVFGEPSRCLESAVREVSQT